jgi:hypothetical protein
MHSVGDVKGVLAKLQSELAVERRRTGSLTQQLCTRDNQVQDMRRDLKLLREVLHDRERELTAGPWKPTNNGNFQHADQLRYEYR